MSRPSQSPPIPSIAFSEGSALLTTSELSEALILPKKERESPFKVRRRTASTDAESSHGLLDPKVWSPPVIAILGTREKMETWLRESGPGSSCLWAQTDDFSVDSRRKLRSGQLKLSYRLRSEQSLTLPVLSGTLLELSPVAQKEGFKRIILHQQDSGNDSLRSAWDAHGNPSGIVSPNPDGSSDLDRKSVGVANRNEALNLVMPERAYRQLLQMVSPGGVVLEYQCLLRRAAENSNFLDMDFQLVDLPKWLSQHPFAVFWEETDVVIVRKEVEGLKWTLLRYDFEGGVIRSTQGASVCDLEITFGNRAISKICASRRSRWGEPAAGDIIWKAKEKELDEVRSKLEWKIWKSVSSGQKYTSVSPLTLMLIDILGSSATVSAGEIEALKFLFNPDPSERSTRGQEEISGMSAIQTIVTCRDQRGLTAKEKYALANLRSESKDLRLEGICTLLELLLKTGDGAPSSIHSTLFVRSKSPPSHSNPDTSRSSSILWLHSEGEDIEYSFREQLRRENKSGEAPEVKGTTDGGALEVERSREPRSDCSTVKENFQGVDSEVGLPNVENQKHTAHKTAKSWLRCEEHDCVHQREEDGAKHEVGVKQITEWVKNGFLEVLVEKLLTRFRGVQKQDDKMGKSLQFNFETVLEACLKVIELLPGEGISRMVDLILQSLLELLEVIAKLSSTEDNVGGGGKEGEKTSCNVSSKDLSLLFDRAVLRSQSSHESKLQETFAKALKLSKLVFAVITRSSLLAGSLAVSGGLDLILDFYSCLLKNFPVNLRLGAKSVDKTFCEEGVLPGEVLKGQVPPLKVLPCIFPSFCMCRVAQACLMDCCVYPLQEKVELIWPTATSDSLCNLSQFMNCSDTDVAARLLADETCNNPIERLLTFTPSSRREPEGCGLTSNGNLNPGSFSGKVEMETQETSAIILPSCDHRFDLSRAPPNTTDIDGPKDLKIPISPQQKLRRPYVPRLPLNSIQLSKSNSNPATATAGGSKVQPTCGSGDLASIMHSNSSSNFDILKSVSDVKYELLRSMVTLFATRSLSFMRMRGYPHQKLQGEKDNQLVLRFLPDMIGGFLNTAPDHTVWRTKRILLQVVSILDKRELCGGMCAAEGLSICPVEDAQGGPRWSGPGPPPVSNDCRRSVDILLSEIGERLTCMVFHLTETFTKSEANGKDDDTNQTWIRTGTADCCNQSLITKTLYCGHMLSLWVDIGLLLKFLGDFVLLWPEEGSARLLLRSCGKPIEKVFCLLAKLSCQGEWNLAQILAMQHLFILSTVCINSAAHDKSPDPQVRSEVDNFFWQLLIESDSNWTCVKYFADWVLLRSCQGCVRALLEGYQKVLWEPLEIYYSMIGQRVNPPWTQRKGLDSLRRGETLRKSILPLLRASILMMKKKLKGQCESSQTSPVFYMSRLIFLLDFLMNPVEGLLMTVIKAPTFCGQLNKVQRETVTSSVTKIFNSRGVKHQSTFECTPQPPLSANKEPFYTKDTKGLCKKCAMSASDRSCSQKFTLSMKHECVCILADIFSLKAFEASEEQTNLCINPRTQNPFLFRKYVTPFLEIIFLCFLKCYSDRGEYSERELQLPWLMSSQRQHFSGRYRKSANCFVQSNEPVKSAEESPDCRTRLSSKDKDELVTGSIRSHEDEAASVACILYARVLLALAQNQTDDVSQGFQQVRVMDFLVQQIGLEYEVSQVATPREILQAGRANNTPLLSANLQDYSDIEARIRKAVHIRREERSSSSELSTIREGESTQTKLYEKLGGGSQLEFHVLSGTNSVLKAQYCQVSESPSTSVGLRAIPSPVILFKEESRLDRTPSHSSKKTFKEQTLNTVPELAQGFGSRESGCCLGFHSARDIRSTDFAKTQSYCILLDEALLKVQQKDAKWQRAMALTEVIPNDLLPFRERNRNIILNSPVLSERGTTSTWTLFQRDRGVSATFNRNFLQKNENIIELSLGSRRDVVAHTVEAKVALGFPPTPTLCNSESARAVNDQIAPPREEKKQAGNTGSSSTAVKYTGRFFDLNEEVERELAEESSPPSGSCITEDAESSKVSERLPNDNLSQQRRQLADQRATAVGSSNLLMSLENVPSKPDSTERPDLGTKEKDTPARPAIPRLKLPKSVRKGGQDGLSGTTVDLELLASTTSTQESKGRLNSLLELQKEFDCDKADRSWRLGSYDTERLRRKLYRHPGLHVLLLELYIALMLNIQGTLEACYSDRFPMENRKLNAPFFLSYHLNHAANSYLLPCLSKRMKDFKPAAYRILKLTWRALFTPLLYGNRKHIAHGAFAQVYTATVRGQSIETEDRVVLKVIDVPKGPHDPCRFFDVFSEVEILERFVGEPRICQILDYGVEAESFVLVLKHYKSSLRVWRERHENLSTRSHAGVQQQQVFYKTLPLYLEVYSAVLQAVKVFQAENVVHYDLKCDNILLEPVDPSCSESVFWTPVWPPTDTANPLPFRVCIADFGQSKASLYLGGECTVRNRGTEYVKSPEMLKLLSSQSQKASDSNIRRVGEAVGKAVDVWSLGCLLYELLTGEYLLYDDDWLRFFIRVTSPSEELIPEEKAAKVDNYGPVMDLLRFVLVRDPMQRPTLDDLTICVEQLQLKILDRTEASQSEVTDLTSMGLTDVFSDEEIVSDSTSSLSDGQTFEPLDVCLHPEKPQHRPYPFKNCLMCLNRLFCQCDCVRE